MIDNGLDNIRLNALALLAWRSRHTLRWLNERDADDMLRETSADARGQTYVNLETGEYEDSLYENDTPAYEIVIPNLDLSDSGNTWFEALLYRGGFLDQLAAYGYDVTHPILAPGAYGPTGFSGVRFRQTNASA